jgi:hypothetical protein
MKIKDGETGTVFARAELWLEGRYDVELLRELLSAYDRQYGGTDQAIIVPIPIPGDLERQTSWPSARQCSGVFPDPVEDSRSNEATMGQPEATTASASRARCPVGQAVAGVWRPAS